MRIQGIFKCYTCQEVVGVYLSIDDACDVKLLRINFQETRFLPHSRNRLLHGGTPPPRPPPPNTQETGSHLFPSTSSGELVGLGEGSDACGNLVPPLAPPGAGDCRGNTLWSVSLCGVFCKPSTGARCLRPRVRLLDTERIAVGRVGISFALPGLSFLLQPGLSAVQLAFRPAIYATPSCLSHY